MRTKVWTIYALVDPSTAEVRYIGQTCDFIRRTREHARGYDKGRTHKNIWVRSLSRAGLEPLVIVLEECAEETYAEAERRWIARYRSAGARLTNLTDGGEGAPGHIKTEEERKKLSLALKGRKRPPEVGQKMSATKKRNGPTQKSLDAIRLVSLGNIGRKHSAESRAKKSTTLTGRKYGPAPLERRAKMSAGMKGIKKTDEHRAKLSAAVARRTRDANGRLL